jgi:Protein of unknown function (DUF4238)
MGEARAHHFVSQCYLRGFTRNGGKKSQLFVIDLERHKTFETLPANVAHVRDFNRVEGLPAGALENALGKFETDATKALRKIGANRSLDDTDAWNVVLNLAALFAVRHPLHRENVRRFTERISKISMEIALATPERWASQMRQARAAGAIGSELDVPYEEMRDFVHQGEYTVSVPTARHVESEFRSHDAVLRCLVARHWTLYVAKAGAGHFFTCDDPVVLVHSDGSPSTMTRPVGYGLTGTTVFFPINRELFASGTFEVRLASGTWTLAEWPTKTESWPSARSPRRHGPLVMRAARLAKAIRYSSPSGYFWKVPSLAACAGRLMSEGPPEKGPSRPSTPGGHLRTAHPSQPRSRHH